MKVRIRTNPHYQNHAKYSWVYRWKYQVQTWRWYWPWWVHYTYSDTYKYALDTKIELETGMVAHNEDLTT